MRRDTLSNQYYRNLLPFAVRANREEVRLGDKLLYRSIAGAHAGEVGIIMLPADVVRAQSSSWRQD